MARTLYLIDGHAQFFRAYHAIRTRMTSPVTKEPTNLTYGFVGMLLKLLRDYTPEHLAVVIDVSGDRESFRSELYPEYKANREAAPEDFGPQVERCLDILRLMNIPVFGEEGVEADDVIASIVTRLRHDDPDLNIRIVSRDKDLTQLLRPGVELFDVHKDTSVGPADIFKTEGVEPHHVVDILALMGDSVDNVPGVAGIGPKTAAKLVLQYGSVEGVYDHLDEIKGKRHENLEAARDVVPLSKQLVALRDDLEVPFDLDAAVVDPTTIPVGALSDTFNELNFNSHRETLLKLVGSAPVESAAVPDGAPSKGTTSSVTASDPLDGGLFAGMLGDTPSVVTVPDDVEYTAITTEAALADVVAAIRAAGRCAVDTETTHLEPMRAALCGISIATEAKRAVYIPVRSPESGAHLDERTVLDALAPVLTDSAITKIGQNIKYDLIVFRRHGIELAGPLFDTMVASYVLDATRSSHGMNALALAFLGHTCIPISQLIGSGKKQKTFDTVPIDQATPYAAEDADITWRLHEVFAPLLDDAQLTALFRDTEMPLVRVLADLEYHGIRVDRDELERQRERLQTQIDALRTEIEDAAPRPFNPDSPKQLAGVLFNPEDDDEAPGLGLKVVKRGKTGPSTDVEVLEKLAEDPAVETPIPQLILELRQLTKLVGTYLVSLAECIHDDTGRVHASFNQTVAATGRLSSSDPNLQNIPIRTEVGREIRRAFVAEDGNVLVTADYSQIELRLLAHLAEDPALIEAFQAGEDIHTAVAAETFGVELGDVTGAQRTTAKMINFGIVYGVTAFGLARRLGGGMTNREAQQIIDDYKARYARIDEFLQSCVHAAHEHGYVETILGRRRLIPQVTSSRPQERAYGERMAINTVVQGSAADLIKLAMIHIADALPDACPHARMILQIHDELVFEVPATHGAELETWVTEKMAHAMELRVPLEVSTAVSSNWYDAK